MAEIILDLSGQKGLAKSAFLDTDLISQLPNSKIATAVTDIVAGNFNPYIRHGYMAPVITSATTLTTDVAPTTTLSSVEFDSVAETVYWGDGIKTIYTGSSLIDTSLTVLDTIEYNSMAYEELYDLQTYVWNGERALYFVGKGYTNGETAEFNLAYQASRENFSSACLSVKAAASIQPTIVDTERDYATGSATSTTISFTVPSGTNQALHVIVYNEGPGAISSVTFNGDSLTESSETADYSGESHVGTYYIANPDVTTANIVVTYGTSCTHRLVYAILTNNTDQTTPHTTSTASKGLVYPSAGLSGGVVTASSNTSGADSLAIVSFISAVDTTVSIDAISEIYNGTITYGYEYLATINDPAYGLQIGRALLPVSTTSSEENTFSSLATTLGSFTQVLINDFAFMRVADNGLAYIFADNHVHKLDGNTSGGTSGAITKNVLLFPDDFTITDAVDYRSRLYLAIHRYPVTMQTTSAKTFPGKCGIYVWNRISTQLSSADYIELPGVREIKKLYASPDGQLKVICVNENGMTELRQFGYNDSGGVVFPVVQQLGIGAHPQLPDGLVTAGDKVVWSANDGKIYCEANQAVTQLFQIKTPGTTTATTQANITAGAAFFGNGDETASTGYRSNKQAITFSYLDGSTHYIKKIYPFDLKDGSNTAQAQAQGDVYTAVNFLPITSTLRNVRVYNLPTSSSGTTTLATVKLYFNQSTTASGSTGMTKTITMDEAKRGYVDFKIHKAYIHSVQIEIEWATGVNLGDDTYLPSMAIITYEDTTTQSPDNG